MNRFYAQNGHFWLDDQPQLIHAGEFHYFRTPVAEWPQRLGLLKAAGFNTLATYIPWLWHQIEEDVSDVDGRSHPMRDLAGFLDLAADMGFLLIPRPGPYIMAETINEGIPPWVFTNYPQTAFISQDGKTQNIVSYLHPDFLACVKKWFAAVFAVLTPRQITHGGKIIMVQLDNEMGMPHWVRNIMDVNPDTLTRFAAFLNNKYGDQIAQRYTSGDLPAFLREGILRPVELYAANIVEDYRHFYRQYLHDYMAFLWAEAKANGMDVPPVVNIHGFMNGGKTFPIGISQLVRVMEMPGMISATDVYPLIIGEGNFHQLLFVNETTKAVHNKEQALFSIEFQCGGNPDFGNTQSSFFDLHTRLCISSGMRAINHYLFTAGENHPILSPVKRHDWGPPIRKDGTTRKHYPRYGKLSAALNSYGLDLIRAQPHNVATLGFFLDHFMTEVNNAFTQEATNIITHQRECILCDFLTRGLTLTHRPFDAIELTRANLDATKTPHLWLMMEKRCPAAVQQKLVDYVNQGGRLVMAGRICEADEDNTPCTILKDALGIQQLQSDFPFITRYINAFHYQDIPVSFLECYTGRFNEVIATDHDGGTAGFVQHLGRGKAILFGAALTADNFEDLDLVNQMALKMELPSLFKLSTWADVRISRGDNGRFLFINNYQDDPIETTIEYEGQPLFGGNPVSLPARQGAILPLDWQVNPAVTIDYITSEIREISHAGDTIHLTTAQKEFSAELTLTNHNADNATTLHHAGATKRIKLDGKDGTIVLRPS
jgi:beta-galactosidase